MNPGPKSVKDWMRESALEQEAKLAADEQEAAKHPQFIFYFCGKIAKNDWRHKILDLRGEEYPLDDYRAGRVAGVRHALGPGLHYGGPFFVGCDHGCYHGSSTHGVGRDLDTYDCAGVYVPSEHEIVVNCQTAIAAADIVFAWLDDLTAYGSFAELGIACALHKAIWIARPKPLPDLWFIEQMASATLIAESPQLAFRELLFTQLNRSFYELSCHLCNQEGNCKFTLKGHGTTAYKPPPTVPSHGRNR
jgi:hypothetical protein